jgi:hypothetical protein
MKEIPKKEKERLKEQFGRIKQEDFDFELIRRYFDNRDEQDELQVISEKTCQDLDFEELFMYLDCTHSKPGQQYLYDRLRRIPADESAAGILESNIKKIKQDEQLRVDLQSLLSGLNKPEALYISTLFQEEHKKPPRWFTYTRILPFVNLLFLGLTVLNGQFLVPFVVVTILNLVIHYWNKQNVTEYVAPLPQLIRLNQVARKLLDRGDFGHDSAEVQHAIRALDQVRSRMSIFRLEARLQSDLESLIWGVVEIIKIVFLLEPILFFRVMRRLESLRNEVHLVFEFVGSVDIALSVLSLRQGLHTWCTPVVRDPVKAFQAKSIYHPLIENCVPNDMSIQDRSVLLTGSNMSGKTSFIRTVGVNTITGLTINTCFASFLQMPRWRIFSAIRLSDDLLNDKSFYFEEVLTIKEMIEASQWQEPHLFLLDEIYKGTNTVERIAAGKAVLSYLNKGCNMVFVSTHDVELTDYLDDQYDLYHFTEQVRNRSVHFDYKLKKGRLTTRNAIRILQINGYPPQVYREAEELAAEITRMKVMGG